MSRTNTKASKISFSLSWVGAPAETGARGGVTSTDLLRLLAFFDLREAARWRRGLSFADFGRGVNPARLASSAEFVRAGGISKIGAEIQNAVPYPPAMCSRGLQLTNGIGGGMGGYALEEMWLAETEGRDGHHGRDEHEIFDG